MARPVSQVLTDHELAIMQTLWLEAPLTVAEILERLSKTPKPAYTSLLTAVRAMEKKGLLTHSKDGKAFRYAPVLEKAKYKQSVLKRLVGSVFEGNALDLAVNLFKGETLGKGDVKKLKQMLEGL